MTPLVLVLLASAPPALPAWIFEPPTTSPYVWAVGVSSPACTPEEAQAMADEAARARLSLLVAAKVGVMSERSPAATTGKVLTVVEDLRKDTMQAMGGGLLARSRVEIVERAAAGGLAFTLARVHPGKLGVVEDGPLVDWTRASTSRGGTPVVELAHHLASTTGLCSDVVLAPPDAMTWERRVPTSAGATTVAWSKRGVVETRSKGAREEEIAGAAWAACAPRDGDGLVAALQARPVTHFKCDGALVKGLLGCGAAALPAADVARDLAAAVDLATDAALLDLTVRLQAKVAALTAMMGDGAAKMDDGAGTKLFHEQELRGVSTQGLAVSVVDGALSVEVLLAIPTDAAAAYLAPVNLNADGGWAKPARSR